jgi:nitrogen fixation protein FixH
MRACVVWPSFVLGIALTSLSGATWLVYAAHSDPSFAVEPDYYAKAVRWDEIARQNQENKRLGWMITMPERSRDRLVVHLSDAEGRSLVGAAVTAVAFANARAGERYQLDFVDEGNGQYSAPLQTGRGGLWRFRFSVTHGGDIVTSEFDRSLSHPMPTEPPS